MTARLDESDLPALQHARLLWSQSRWDEAEAAFLKALEQHPHNLHALVDTARVLGDRMEVRRAREVLDHLTALAGDRADLLLLLGQTMRMCDREEEALDLLLRYTSGSGRRDVAGHLELAVLYERRQRLDEADAAATAALRCAPECMEALVIRARVRRQRGELESAAAALRRVAQHPHTYFGTRAQAWTMLADMADRAGDTAAAVKRLERAKELLRPPAAGMARVGMNSLGAWDRVCRGLTREIADEWISQQADSAFQKPAVHLLGFPRSGTTLLENVLDAHPGIVSSEERPVLGRDLLNVLWREPGNYSPPTREALSAVAPENLAALRRRYRERMEEGLGGPVGARLHIDKNPTHTLFIPGILRLLPDSRFLVALRDPRDVVVSCCFQYLPLNPNSACFLTWEDTIRRYLLDMGAWLHLRTVLPPDRWLEVRYEDLVSDLPSRARRAVEWLGLPWDDAVLEWRERVAEKVVHTPSYLAVREPVHTRAVARWRRYEKWMQPHLELLRPIVAALGYEW
jgi:tetratricopeptide (TPR) repeat protein